MQIIIFFFQHILYQRCGSELFIIERIHHQCRKCALQSNIVSLENVSGKQKTHSIIIIYSQCILNYNL